MLKNYIQLNFIKHKISRFLFHCLTCYINFIVRSVAYFFQFAFQLLFTVSLFIVIYDFAYLNKANILLDLMEWRKEVFELAELKDKYILQLHISSHSQNNLFFLESCSVSESNFFIAFYIIGVQQ